MVTEARLWLGTPYQHQASLKHIGCDCLGLLRGVWRHIYGVEPELMPAYAPRWNEASSTDLLMDMAARNFVQKLENTDFNAGDVLLFKYRLDLPSRHIGIVSGEDKFIHAYSGRGVVENRFNHWWKRHLAGRYMWPIRLKNTLDQRQ